MKFLLPLLLTALTASSIAKDIPLEGTIAVLPWPSFSRQSTCTVKGQFEVLLQDTTVTSVNGSPNTQQPNNVVRFFQVRSKIVQYIPKGLDKLFTQLTGLRFDFTKLKYVGKENLQPFPELVMFSVVGNQLQFIPKDLFVANTKLQVVNFRANRITYIDQAVFNHLRVSLNQLYIDGTAIACGLFGAVNRNFVERVIDRLQTSPCSKIENAPALYAMTVGSQGADSCAVQVAAETQKCQVELTKKDEDCRATNEKEKENQKQIEECINNPNAPGCPQNDLTRWKNRARP